MTTYDGFFTASNWLQRVVLFLCMCFLALVELPIWVGVRIASLGEKRK